MERKKEKIMLLSLQRRQQQEEAKARKEIQAMQRREKEREKEDERVRKREEQAARRAAILEQHKLKKAIEEAEQKGIALDRNDLLSLKQQHAMLSHTNSGASSSAATKMRPQKVIRPRPKTIHVETGSVDLSDASSLSSRNKKGSNSNLTGMTMIVICSIICFIMHAYRFDFWSNFFLLNVLHNLLLFIIHNLYFEFLFILCVCFFLVHNLLNCMIHNCENTVGIGQLNPSPMRRDYYRGSQDSLAVRGKL